ncbi:MAG: hypothetical protein AAB284_00760 [Chloroflexota bacterium]
MRAVAVVQLRGPVTDARHAKALDLLCAALPRVGVLDRGIFACDLRGTARLLGAPERVGARIVGLLERLGIAAAIGIAERPFAARVLAERVPAGEVRRLDGGDEPAFLAALPLSALPLEDGQREELVLLGIRAVGSFAALDRGAVLDRFGRAGAAAHALARGEDAETVRGIPPRRRIAARRMWDEPLASREQLLFGLRAAVDEIAATLASDGLAALRLVLRLDREDAPPLRLERVVLPPTANASALLRSLRWGMEEWREIGLVIGARIEATEVEPARGRQIGLFAPDGAREEEAIAVARHLRARLGPGTVLRADVVDPDARLPERASRWEEAVS